MLLTERLMDNTNPAASGLRVTRLATDGECARLGDEWNRLAGNIPFRRWEWLESWWRHFQRPGDQLFLLTVRDSSGRLVGLAPWYIATSKLFGSVVQFLGSGVVCSDYLTILTADGFADAVAERIADWMVDDADIAWDAVELNGVDAADTAVATFTDQLIARGHVVHRAGGLSCWRVPLPETWESYLKRLSKTRRERVRQLHRRNFDTGRAVVRVAQSPEELEQGFAVLVDLHQRRRNSLGQHGCFSQLQFTNFLRETADRFLRLGRLHLQWIELEDRPAAVEIDLTGGDTVYHYQSGIDPDRPRERPGWLGTSAALKSCIEQGFKSFDFLRGDETYKSHWRAEPVETLDVRIASHSAAARLRHELWVRRQNLKTWVKTKMNAKG